MVAEEVYDLKKSIASIGHLYKVKMDAHGNVIDGFHRLEADPDWPTETKEDIKTPLQLILARIIANTHRREVGRKERREQLIALADALLEVGIPREGLVSEIAELTSFTERYVQKLLPKDYKRAYNSALRADMDESSGMSEEEVARIDKKKKVAAEALKELLGLESHYGPGIMDTVKARGTLETRRKYLRRYVTRLNEQAPAELKRKILEGLKFPDA